MRQVTKAELQLLQQMWKLGPASVREIRQSLPAKARPAYTTVQTLVSRLEEKRAVRRVRKDGNALIFEAVYTEQAVHRRLIREFLDFFGGSAEPVVSHLVETGELSLADLRLIEKKIRQGGGK